MTSFHKPTFMGWRIYEYFAMVIGLGTLAMLCILWMPFALALNIILPENWGMAVGRVVISKAFAFYIKFIETFCYCKFNLKALDKLHCEKSLIVVANHPSLLDAVIILSKLPNAVCIMKSAIMNNILFGAGARLAKYIRNDSLLMIKDSVEALNAGGQLLIFPEGTRTVTEPINDCKRTAGFISKRSRVPVQVLLIKFSSNYLGKKWPLFRPANLPFTCTVSLGERFLPPENHFLFTNKLENYFRKNLVDAN